jgi:hypothetical protein
VEILSKGEDGYIGIGFCAKDNGLERLPGRVKRNQATTSTQDFFFRLGLWLVWIPRG